MLEVLEVGKLGTVCAVGTVDKEGKESKIGKAMCVAQTLASCLVSPK